MTNERRGREIAEGCLAWLRKLWEWLLRLFRRVRSGAASSAEPVPGITVENIIGRHAVAVDDPGPGNGIPRVALEIVRDDTAAPSLIAAGEIVVPNDRIDDDRVAGLLEKGGFKRIAPPGDDTACAFSRWRSDSVRGTALLDVVNDLRAGGVNVGGNWVLPFGSHITMKSGGGPEPAPIPAAGAWFDEVAAKRRRETDRRVRVAVVDTGVNRGGWAEGFLASVTETDSNRDVLDVINAVSGQGGPDGFLDAGAGHGTFIAGIVRQFAPSAEVVVYRALDTDGVGHDEAIACTILRASREADGPLVINLSLGGTTDGDKPPVAVAHAVDTATERGAVVVAAAGNSASPRATWPAALPGVLAVSSIGSSGRPSDFGNFGWWVDFAAVGEAAVSTFVAGRESPEFDPSPDDWTGQAQPAATWQGTSFAAPKVAAGIANLLLDGMSPLDAVAELRRRGPSIKGYGVALSDDVIP